MKHFIIILLCVLQVYYAGAQTKVFPRQPRFDTGAVEITLNKTTMLLFPYPVKPGDVGSGDVIAQKVKGVDNAVKIKAARRNFAPTNISVFTADGKLYAINLFYKDSTAQTVYCFGDRGNASNLTSAAAEPMDAPLNQAMLDSTAAAVLEYRGFIRHPAARTEKVRARVTGIYYAGGTLFVRLSLFNSSFIPYEIDFARTTVETVSGGKRKVRLAEQIMPVCAYGMDAEITNGDRREVMLVYSKFTLSKDRRLIIRLYERQGQRDLVLPIRAGTFSRARPALVN